MRRRSLLSAGGTGLLGALAGCTGLLGPAGEWRLRARRADRDATDYTCDLDPAFVDAHPDLRTVLSRASENPKDEWCDPLYLGAEEGNALGAELSEHCGDGFRGLYFYEGDAFFVSLADINPGNGKGHDAGHDGHNHTHDA